MRRQVAGCARQGGQGGSQRGASSSSSSSCSCKAKAAPDKQPAHLSFISSVSTASGLNKICAEAGRQRHRSGNQHVVPVANRQCCDDHHPGAKAGQLPRWLARTRCRCSCVSALSRRLSNWISGRKVACTTDPYGMGK